MSPSEQLPPRPSLRQLRNRAKDLLQASRQGEPDAIRRIGESHPRFSGLSQAEIAAAEIVLADAQLVIARELGFDSWPRLKKHVESLSQPATSMHQLVTGDNIQAMQEAVAQDPESVNQPNESGLPPLYTAALFRNRQAIDFLLEHGAIVDIFACAYLGRATDAESLLERNPELARATTRDGMTALHFAARAGHIDVVDVLLRHHSDVNALDQPWQDRSDGSVSRRAVEVRTGRRNHSTAARPRRTDRSAPGRGDGADRPRSRQSSIGTPA